MNIQALYAGATPMSAAWSFKDPCGDEETCS